LSFGFCFNHPLGGDPFPSADGPVVEGNSLDMGTSDGSVV
jgi:hypothetical protein